jgi:hypothetical protein
MRLLHNASERGFSRLARSWAWPPGRGARERPASRARWSDPVGRAGLPCALGRSRFPGLCTARTRGVLELPRKDRAHASASSNQISHSAAFQRRKACEGRRSMIAASIRSRAHQDPAHTRSWRNAALSAWPPWSTGSKRSPCRSTRSSASRMPKSRGRTFSPSSSQRNGVDTGAPGFGRTE